VKITVENAGKVFFVLCLGVVVSLFGFLFWAVISHGLMR